MPRRGRGHLCRVVPKEIAVCFAVQDREAEAPRENIAEIDRGTVAGFMLPPTRPLRVYRRNWSWAEVALGNIAPDCHEL